MTDKPIPEGYFPPIVPSPGQQWLEYFVRNAMQAYDTTEDRTVSERKRETRRREFESALRERMAQCAQSVIATMEGVAVQAMESGLNESTPAAEMDDAVAMIVADETAIVFDTKGTEVER